ncbi:MAG TPA: hypothetical protein PLL30_00765 [Candidatus Krumholzibacteria bacterium]|nr:hypothetical protein [Candidatus Krumholzibacteria bacterium]HPD70292.1 hypothetical protein [Candidatus Krumholzibacteria bacterium]HRY40008.1 hypothetical protein [Candidatus Krumholzibacteria bacterium]
MERILGPGNTIVHYLWVLVVYLMMLVLMRYGNQTVELSYRRTRAFLIWTLGPIVFIANWLLFRAGAMSFLPWLNNVLHALVWVGVGLTFLYAGCRTRAGWEQFALFAVFSFVVKVAEHLLLGTWEHDNFFGIPGQTTYMAGWSALDGLLPFVIPVVLRQVARIVPGIMP